MAIRVFHSIIGVLLAVVAISGCTEGEMTRERAAAEIKLEFERVVDVWYPLVLDTLSGGYITRFTYDWQPTQPQDKMIVSQARHLWSIAGIAGQMPEQSDFEAYGDMGFRFLRDQMWDSVHGGFFQTVTRQGQPRPVTTGQHSKTLYGNAFALYSLIEWYRYSGDPEVLDLARKTFEWLELHARDSNYGGYYSVLQRDGTPVTVGESKEYTSSIQMLASLAELYTIWPDGTVREGLETLFLIVRDRMISESGYLKLNFSRDWNHLSLRDSPRNMILENIGSDHISPGHDLYTAAVLLRSAEVLGTVDEVKTHRIAKQLVDHSLAFGWDTETGGVFNMGYYFEGDDQMTVVNRSKTWWAQANALQTFLIMADLYPDDPMNYEEKFFRQWIYIRTYLIDREHGGWFEMGLDQNPEQRDALKSHIWKGSYHTIRSLIKSINRLDAGFSFDS